MRTAQRSDENHAPRTGAPNPFTFGTSRRYTTNMTDTVPKKPKRPQLVYTLLIEVGRNENDGLPKGATGGALMCFASGVDEPEAVRETVAVLKQADLAPLDVTGYGTLEERLDQGHDISDEERGLMQQALDENSVVVYQLTPFFEDQKIDTPTH